MERLKSLKWPSQTGDTIIEVLLSMAILALVLGTAYVSSTHSLQNGVDAGNRNRALSYAQEQIEFMKNTAFYAPATAGTYKSTKAFCIDPADGKSPVFDDDTTPPATWDNTCKTYRSPNSQYSMKIEYTNSTQVFTITTNWAATNGSGQDELKLYYKLPS